MTLDLPTDNPVLAGAIVTLDDADRDPDRYALRDAFVQGRRFTERIPVRYANAVPDAPEVVTWVRELVAAAARFEIGPPRIEQGRSLLLIGGTGSGKTYQALGAVRALAHSGATASYMVTTSADLYAALRPRHRVDAEEEFERYARASVLVLDDLGAAKGTEWTEEVNYRIVNYRYERAKPTLITTNVPAKGLQAALGERVVSRLIEMADRVDIKGADRRIAARAVTP